MPLLPPLPQSGEKEVSEEEVKEKLETVIDRVRAILQSDEDARNSDLYLMILYLRRYTELGKYISFIPYDLIKEYDGIFENIRRARQKLNEQGFFLPTDPKVLKRRRRLAKEYKKLMPRLEV
jgi:hypothetical protein